MQASDYPITPLRQIAIILAHCVVRILIRRLPKSCDGSCIYPHVARQTAWMHRDRVAHVWRDEIFIFVAGLGQGAGTGFAQAFSWQAMQAGAYPVPLILMPCSGEIHPVPLEPEVRRLERAADGFGRYVPEDYNPDALVKDVYKASEDRLVWELRTL